MIHDNGAVEREELIHNRPIPSYCGETVPLSLNLARVTSSE
jgi:hypothetical protein